MVEHARSTSHSGDKHSATQQSTTATPESKGLVKVELLAEQWDRPKAGGGFRKFRKGSQLYVTQAEFDSLNGPHAFKPSFRVLDETADKE